MKPYHTIFLTNLPAFYKINLFNAIAQREKVLAVFMGEKKNKRNSDFFHGERMFDFCNLRGGTLMQCLQLMRLLMEAHIGGINV